MIDLTIQINKQFTRHGVKYGRYGAAVALRNFFTECLHLMASLRLCHKSISPLSHQFVCTVFKITEKPTIKCARCNLFHQSREDMKLIYIYQPIYEKRILKDYDHLTTRILQIKDYLSNVQEVFFMKSWTDAKIIKSCVLTMYQKC